MCFASFGLVRSRPVRSHSRVGLLAVSKNARFEAGSGVPLVTPFRDGAIDADAFAALIEFQIDAQSDALVICGSTGENQALSLAERGRQIELAKEIAGDRIAIVAATGCETEIETIMLSERAAKAGVDGLLLITPRATAASQDGTFAYLSAIAARTDLPFYVYNYPSRTHVDIAAETIERLALAHPHVVGLKQTDGNLRLITQVRRRLGPDFRIFCGIEQLALPGLALGSAGMITASANVVPHQMRDLYRAFRAGDLTEARRLHDVLGELFDAVVYAESSPAAALKYMLRRAGRLQTNEHRLPAAGPSPQAERRLDRVLAALADAVAAA